MAELLNALEWLARYGIIDIAFGLGIGGFIVSVFRRRTVKEIEGVEISIWLAHSTEPDITHKSKLYFDVANQSAKPLYIYRTLFRPRHRTFQSSDLLRMSDKLDTVPGTGGWYRTFVESKPGEKRKLPVFMEHGETKRFFVSYAEDYSLDEKKRKQLEDLRARQALGTLMIYCICGAEQKIIKTGV